MRVPRRIVTASLLGSGVVAVMTLAQGGHAASSLILPNGLPFPNPSGASQIYSTQNGGIDLTGPFFQSLGTNGRSCASCHLPTEGMSISAANTQLRFTLTGGTDPIFRTNDGSNCDHNIDVSTVAGRSAAYSLLRTRGLIRVTIGVPAAADYQVMSVENPYGCNESDVLSQYRRPLPASNLRFLSAVMWDGRESSPLTGTTKIGYSNDAQALHDDLAHQAMDAVNGHAQGNGSRPTPTELQQIVDFEMALYSAQAIDARAGFLNANGANGGPLALTTQPFFLSINSSVNFLIASLEQPGGLNTAGDGQFTSNIFSLYGGWANSSSDARAAIARGQALFNTRAINITGVAGINDDAAAGGLLAGGIASLTGTCGTCHDTPNVGNHSFAAPLNIGTGDFNSSSPSENLGGLDVSYLPKITACKKDPVSHQPTNNCKTTTDLGQALIDGTFDHIGKIKGPVLRSLAARAPYFHNGSAASLRDVVTFYEQRFGMTLTAQEESDLVAFLNAL